MNFQKCYTKIRALTKDIDGISTKQHFHFVVRKNGGSLITCDNEKEPPSSHKKQGKAKFSGSQKQEEDVFFSFPADDRIHHRGFTIFAKKDNPSKTMYRLCGETWEKVNE